MILATTPTGDIGARVLRHLLDAGEHVRVIVRDAAKLPGRLSERVDLVEGSHGDGDVIGPALDGVTRVFWLPPGSLAEPDAHTAYVEFSRPFVNALPSSDVTHVVGISALGRGWTGPAGQVTASLAMDDLIGATGVAYRALTCASLMDNIALQADAIREQGTFHEPTPGDLKQPHVAKSDVAKVAASLLVDTGWSGAEEVPMHGPEDLTFEEMAATLSDVLAHPVAFHAMTMDRFGGLMRSSGASEGMAQAYVEMMMAKNEGMDAMDRTERRGLTPTTFRQWCETELKPIVERQSA